MKRKKQVYMECPNCGAEFPHEPIIMIQADGGSHVEYKFPRKCKFCETGLMRRVRK